MTDEPDPPEAPEIDSFLRKVARVETSSAAFERSIYVGSRIGRYEIVRRIGGGGMGIVYEARDVELDRQVALKLVRPRGITLADAQRRMRREAQAMARLPSGAHCVAIHDTGTHGDKVFIAMELVPGGTLRTWLAQPRPWREVVRMFVAVGHGLAAAHAAGVVHRDFKPENVLLGAAGEVRIADFGLARSLGPELAAVSVDTVTEYAGTPAYMAPEQLRHGRTDARTDQFSFAVALYEALEGVRPFVGAGGGAVGGPTIVDPDGVTRAVLEGAIRPWARPSPRWLRAAVERGLAREPGQRWPAMNAFLAALARGLAPARWGWWVVAAAGAALIALLLAG